MTVEKHQPQQQVFADVVSSSHVVATVTES
jgi:hypothetical protein